ncbi:clathrin interactor EPSIN 1-like [Iris pallida]|uniref:Clathrin interactor EPSIN 1-like n=1 Tax=Iris pallida TaxID=29817 RepID=A0AAX6E8B9_IRIPA|nr:clathrin interactor EPSIN 1-like [Iris pallida]
MSVLRLKEALEVCSRVSGWSSRLRRRLAASRRTCCSRSTGSSPLPIPIRCLSRRYRVI